MPMQRHLYPDNWDAIARQIKDEVGWCCEACGRQCLQPGESVEQFIERIRTSRVSECPVVADFLAYPRRWLLTVAHLDHRPEHCHRSNLKALCNPCHCRYDLAQMPLKRRLKLERLGQLRLEI